MLSPGGDASSGLTILATKPRGKPAAMLAELGIGILPIEEDEGNVDRYLLSRRVASIWQWRAARARLHLCRPRYKRWAVLSSL